MGLCEVVRSSDWKTEKHVPVIECPDAVVAGEAFDVSVVVGKEVPHPNSTEHHIRWVELHFRPRGSTISYELARCEFSAHGESARGANQGPAYAHPELRTRIQVKEQGTLIAVSYCNIHGLWESSKDIEVS